MEGLLTVSCLCVSDAGQVVLSVSDILEQKILMFDKRISNI